MTKKIILYKFLYEYNNYILPHMDYYQKWYTIKILDDNGINVKLGGYEYNVYLIKRNEKYFWQVKLLSKKAYYTSMLSDSKDSFYDILCVITEDVINLI